MPDAFPTDDPDTAGATQPDPGDGRARRERAQGAMAPRLHAALGELDPQLATWADDFIFGDVWGRPGLPHDDRMLVAITALAATGQTTQLRNYLFGALEAQVPPRRIHEALVMLVVYCGFPVAITAIATWRDVVDSARRRGLTVDLDTADLDLDTGA